MLKEDNKFLFAIVAGLLGALARDAYSIITKLSGVSKNLIWEMGADIFVGKKEIYTIAGYVLGALSDCVMGGLIGVGFGVLIEIFGPKHYLIKGVGTGLVIWLLSYGFFIHVFPQPFQLIPKEALNYISSFVAHGIFGGVMGFAYIKLAKIKVSD